MPQPRPTSIELPMPVTKPSWALEAELARLEARVAELEREQAALEAFAAVAAHELLAPLIMTEAYATMVAEGLDDSRHAGSRRDLAVLSRDVARVRVLVETLLDDLRWGRRSPRHRRLDLESVARACLRSLAPEVEASGAQVEVAQLPCVIGDQQLISVVLTTLITTALSSGRHGGSVVVDGARRSGHWSICVQADGPMIASVARPRHPRIAGGGLNICRHLVERHGGEIRVSAKNRFCLTLPQRN
jgi:light-regulated signal transduction histidine kinase (bacteriophytochrome)